jgi:NitT/TauT family transport system permease protein
MTPQNSLTDPHSDKTDQLAGRALNGREGRANALGSRFVRRTNHFAGLEKLFRIAAQLVVISIWLGGWAILSFNDDLPSPAGVARALVALTEGELLPSIWSSLRRIAVGYLLAIATAVPLGLLMGLYRNVNEAADPLVQLIRPISAVAWIPFAILWFGVTNNAAYFIITYGAFFPILLNTIVAVQEIPPEYTATARTLGASKRLIIFDVILPAALPVILIGLRLGLGNAFAVMVASELAIGFVLQSGLGYLLIRYSIEAFQPDTLLALITVIGLLGYGSDRVLRAFLSRLMPWRAGLT